MTRQEIMGGCQLLLITACLWPASQHSSPLVSLVTLPLIGLKYLDEFGGGGGNAELLRDHWNKGTHLPAM